MCRKHDPLVSILLPSYNHAKYIEAAIDSVYQQTYKNIELIVIDDGSTDKSFDILSGLQEKYGFYLFQQENKGIICTLESLGELANGEYISLFSSDDLYHPEKIELLVEYLEINQQFSMVYSKIALINDQSELVQVIEEPYQAGDIFYELLSGTFFINGLSALVKADAYFSITRTNSYIDDLQFWLALSKNNKIGFVDEVTAYYRIHENHLSKDFVKMQCSEYEILKRYKDDPFYNEAMNEWNLRWFRMFAPCHKRIAIGQFLLKVLRSRNVISIRFLKGLLRLFLPCSK